MPSVRTIIKIKTIIITISLLIGIFVLSFLNGVDSQSGSIIKYMVSDDDNMDDEPEVIGSRWNYFADYTKQDRIIASHSFINFNDFIVVCTSQFSPFSEIKIQTAGELSENEFHFIFQDFLLSIDDDSFEGQSFFYSCKSQ